uniref:G domain-containing protein n=1 Tax=Anolis carolinensis TaxID=28377 RepID=H9GQ56_ANOCA
MGGLFSKPEPAPTQKKEINVNEMMAQPWRNVTWTTEERNKLMSEIAAYHPRLNTVPQFRVLFVGPIQAGKSSFFNSVKSVFRGHVTSQAIAGTDLKSVTTQYKTYQVKNEKDGSTLPIIFCDTMGLEEKQGLDIDDVPIIIKGHIPENYQFNPAGAIQSTSPGYIKDPSFKDQIHCFVFIIEAPKIEILPDNMLEKLKTIRRNTNKLGLPQLVILTKVDEVCPSLGKNVSDVYRSKEVEKKAMGDIFSTPQPQSTQTKKTDVNEMMEQPWRDVTWKTVERKKLMCEIAAYHPRSNSVPQFRVLFMGPVGAGKSSFFNSVKSVIRGYVTTQAPVAGTCSSSRTVQYKTYQIKNEKDGKTLPIIFCDTMGLEEREGAGLHIDDVPNIIKGHVPDKYQLNPAGAMQPTSPGYIKDPSFKDEIHCFVFILEAPKIEILSDKMFGKLKTIIQRTNMFDIPQLVILTKVDEVCPSLEKNISNVYRSKVVETKMQFTAERLGIPLCNIVPVKNYCSELELKENVDILILLALRQILRLADSYLDNFLLDETAVALGDLSSEATQMKKTDANEMMEQPWRDVTWKTEERKKLMSEIEAYHPCLNSVPQFRVLFLGPVGAGKSSFFNSVKSVFQGYVTTQAIVGGISGTSMTMKYNTYQVKNKESGKTLPIIFCDTMGLEEKQGAGLDIDDVPNIIKGYVPDKYQFNPAGAMQSTSLGYIKDPSFKDQIHCFVFILEAPKIEILSDKMLEKLKTIIRRTNMFDLPQLVILTKVDEICPSLGKNISNVYRSKVVEAKMQLTAERLGIPLCNIVPVKNYCSELELKENIDILILLALRQILRLGESYLDNFPSDEIATVD